MRDHRSIDDFAHTVYYIISRVVHVSVLIPHYRKRFSHHLLGAGKVFLQAKNSSERVRSDQRLFRVLPYASAEIK